MFDEIQAVKHINKALNAAFGVTYPHDEILNVIDIIWDYYEDNDLLSLDINNDKELDEDALKAKVRKVLAKDRHTPIVQEHVDAIVDAELDYEAQVDADEM